MIVSIANEYSVPVSEVRAIIDFYHFLSDKKNADYHFYFSNNIIDKMAHSDLLVLQLGERLNSIIQQDPSRVCLDETSCIGLADHAPAALVNGRPLPALNPQSIEEVAELVALGRPLDHWPAHLFQVRTRICRRSWLLNMSLPPGESLLSWQTKGSATILQELQASQLRGRGGAGFATALKWRSCEEQHSGEKYVICNADEGEPGTFKDRVMLSEHSDWLWEGMTLCAATVGASKGFLYLRAEYAYLLPQLETSLQVRRDTGWLGAALKERLGFEFDIQIVLGAGAYICGEESALLESLEGKRGIPRIRPPFPTISGYLRQPTVVNNVETFIHAAAIISKGSDSFLQLGTTQSKGTQLLSISGDCQRPGVYEYAFGETVEQILSDCGADEVQAVQIGGPSGQLLGPQSFHLTLGYEALGGSGSLMIFNHRRSLIEVVNNFTNFFAFESCGFCTPCRVGTALNQRMLTRLHLKQLRQHEIQLLEESVRLMQNSSHCGLGQSAGNSILNLLHDFPETVEQLLNTIGDDNEARLVQALQPAVQLRKS